MQWFHLVLRDATVVDELFSSPQCKLPWYIAVNSLKVTCVIERVDALLSACIRLEVFYCNTADMSKLSLLEFLLGFARISGMLKGFVA